MDPLVALQRAWTGSFWDQPVKIRLHPWPTAPLPRYRPDHLNFRSFCRSPASFSAALQHSRSHWTNPPDAPPHF